MQIVVDLLLNLVAEGLGIVITIFFIDRLLRKREEEKWRPMREYIFAKIFETLGDFLDKVLGSYFESEKRGDYVFYAFGEIKVFGSPSYANVHPFSVIKNLNDYRLLFEAFKEKFDPVPLKILSEKLRWHLSTSAQILEPDLLNLLTRLEDKASGYSQVLLRDDVDLEQEMNGFSAYMYEIVTLAIHARVYLEKKSNGTQPIDEVLKQSMRDVENANALFKNLESSKK